MPEQLRKHLDFDITLDPGDQQELYIFHVCSQDKLLKYLANDRITETIVCNVFGKRIIYTFYGASKYKSGNLWANVSTGSQSVCMIMNLQQCTGIMSIYPFDTGIASGKVEAVRKYLQDWDELKIKLDLGDVKERINKFILHCFESLEDYVKGTYKRDGELSLKAKLENIDSISHISDVHKIILDQTKADERRYCVEVLFENEMEIRPGLLIGVITQASLLNDKKFKELFIRYKISGFIKDNSLFYPSAASTNNEIENEIKEMTIELSSKIIKTA